MNDVIVRRNFFRTCKTEKGKRQKEKEAKIIWIGGNVHHIKN